MILKMNLRAAKWSMKDGKSSSVVLLLVVCMLYGTAAAPEQTLNDLLNKIKEGKKDLSCFVCNSVNGGCRSDNLIKGDIYKCNDVSTDGYLQQVYGSLSLQDTSMPLKNFPPALSESARNSSSPTCSSNQRKACEAGWGSFGFADAYKNNLPTTMGDGKYRFSSLSLERDMKFQSCRMMTISTDVQKNEKTTEILKTSPRIIRTCSFSKGDTGCKTYNLKTATVEVCYCNDKNNCNGATRLHISQYSILMACILVLIKMWM